MVKSVDHESNSDSYLRGYSEVSGGARRVRFCAHKVIPSRLTGRRLYLYRSFLRQDLLLIRLHDVPHFHFLPVAERQAAVRARVDALDVDLDAAQRAQATLVHNRVAAHDADVRALADPSCFHPTTSDLPELACEEINSWPLCTRTHGNSLALNRSRRIG